MTILETQNMKRASVMCQIIFYLHPFITSKEDTPPLKNLAECWRSGAGFCFFPGLDLRTVLGAMDITPYFAKTEFTAEWLRPTCPLRKQKFLPPW